MTDQSTTITNEAELSKSTAHLAEASPQSKLRAHLFDRIHRAVISNIHNTVADGWYPDPAPLLGRDATFQGDASQPMRRYLSDVLPDAPETVSFQVHDVSIDPPQYLEPMTTAQLVVSGTALQTTATRTNGPTDYTGIAVPIISTMGPKLRMSSTFDFLWPFSRTINGWASVITSGDPIHRHPAWHVAGNVAVPAAIGYTWMTIPWSQVGQYVAGTLATVNGADFRFGQGALLVPLPSWSTPMAQVGVHAWGLHTDAITHAVPGITLYHCSSHPTTEPAPTRVLFIVNGAPAANDFSTGAVAPPNASTLPTTTPPWEEYLRFLRASVGDDEQVVRAAVFCAINAASLYMRDDNQPGRLDKHHHYVVNPPDPLAFCLLHTSCISRNADFQDICVPSRWIIPVAREIFFAEELTALRGRVPLEAVMCHPSAVTPFRKRSVECRLFIRDVIAPFGFFFRPEEDTVLPVTHSFSVVHSPNQWFEEAGFPVTSPPQPMQFKVGNAATGQQPYRFVDKKFDPSNHWVASAYARGNAAPVFNLRLDGPGAIAHPFWVAVPINAASQEAIGGATQSQLRPFFPPLGFMDAVPSDSTVDTIWYTASIPDLALFNATGSVLPDLQVSGKDFSVNLLDQSFLGSLEDL